VRGAIARTADTVFNQQLSEEQQRIARNIFLRLTELGEGTQDTRLAGRVCRTGAHPALTLHALAEAGSFQLGEQLPGDEALQ
jgi:hypothetical protein